MKIVENLGTSDHNMVSFSIHHEQNNFVSTRQIRDYNKGDYQSIREELKQIDWHVCMSGNTTECWNNLKKVLLDLEDRYIPLKKIRKVKGNKINSKYKMGLKIFFCLCP